VNHFVRKLITEWRRLELPFAGETLVIGVSGGADSVSLLLGMHELKLAGKLDLRIIAAHFNHRLRDGESDADEDFVRQLTSARKTEFAVGHAEPIGKGNIEQSARLARYAFLSRTAESLGAFAVLTGHTINDQAETFLLNLIRGSGPDGLCGMSPVRPMEAEAERRRAEEDEVDVADRSPFLPFSVAPLLLVRPLLTWAKRLDTESFCRYSGVEYRYDTMNEDTAFRRVRIRKILLPLLEDMNPKIIDTLANTAALMREAPAENEKGVPDELTLAELKALDVRHRLDTIRYWLRHRRGNSRRLQLKHIQAVERLVRSTSSGRMAELPGGTVVKSAGRLRYEENKVDN
jgi:tRNA(Ile)-lysidine synthase